MKLQSIIRKGFVFAGFAALALLPASLKAQEITNTEFDNGPHVAMLAQSASSEQSSTVFTVLPAPQAIRASEAIAAAAEPRPASVIQVPVLSRGFWLTASLIVGLGLITAVEAKRANRNSARPYVSTRSA